MKITIEQVIAGERVELTVTDDSDREVFRVGMNLMGEPNNKNYDWALGGVAATVIATLKHALDAERKAAGLGAK